MAAESVYIYAVVGVKVNLPEGRRPESAQEALSVACDLVDLPRLFRNDRGQGVLEYTSWAEEVMGGHVDFEDDPQYENSQFAPGGVATNYLEHDVGEALRKGLESGTFPLEHLRVVAGSEDVIARSARKGVVVHPEASVEERRAMLAQLADDPYPTREWLKNTPALRNILSPEDLAPLLQAEDAALREAALHFLGELRPTRGARGR